MSNGGSMIDSIRELFSSSGRAGETEGTEGDPVEGRMARVEQIASGVEMAASALPEERKQLRREAEAAAEAALEAARSRLPEGGGGGDAAPPAAGEGAGTVEALTRLSGALEELHYRLLQCEVHPDVQDDEEIEAAADRAREAAEGARRLAGELGEPTAA